MLSDLAAGERKLLINKIKSILTEKQFRRLWLYYVEGKTEQQIANIEGIAQQNVSKSIRLSEKKLKQFFSSRV